jgi:serine/threonine protein kinase
MSEFETVAISVLAAKGPEDVFGKLADSIDRIQAVGRFYRQLVQVLHPDHNPSRTDKAAEAMQKLTTLRLDAEERIRKGIYGTKALTPKPKPIDTVIRRIEVRGKRYVLACAPDIGDICHVYHGTDGKTDHVFKIAQHPADNDLLENEARVLGELTGPTAALRSYQCSLTDSFLLRSKTQSRRVNVLVRAMGYRTLTEVARVYPNGLDYRDVVWMFKRTLAALWYLHGRGYVHGAVLPEHVLVHPITHGAKLIDFCYAVKLGERVRAISGPRRASYAPEILAKEPAGPATDIFMAAKIFRPMLAADTPSRITGFFDGCMLAPIGRRPQDAGDLHEEFDRLLLKLVGKPKYRRLEMPPEGSHP